MSDDHLLDAEAAPDADLDELVHRADLDALVRMIDDRTSSRNWAGLLRLRDRARAAVGTGRQLWPAAALAEYRLALLAPPDVVARVLDEHDDLAGRFTVGPLTEVVAQYHQWEDLSSALGRGPRAAFVAHERVVRGESMPPDLADELAPVIDLPLRLCAWEPDYPVAVYSDSGVEAPPPALPPREATEWNELVLPVDTAPLDDTDVRHAFEQLVEPWLVASNGHAETSCVSGGPAEALAALGLARARLVQVTSTEAIAWLAWAGASGGAHARRRGMATGRFGAWWLIAALGDLLDEFPPSSADVEELLSELRWWRWDAFEPERGWSLQLVVEDPLEGLSRAFLASDAV